MVEQILSLFWNDVLLMTMMEVVVVVVGEVGGEDIDVRRNELLTIEGPQIDEIHAQE